MSATNMDLTRAYAQQQDSKHPLRHLRDEFLIPTKADLKRTDISSADLPHQPTTATTSVDDTSIYLVGNSLGAQPALARQYVQTQLATWATQGVNGHFKSLSSDTNLKPWLYIDEAVAHPMADIVGAQKDEVAVMQTLTANLHFLMAAFYKPTATRNKIILESKAFPSDHFVVQSQLAHHHVPADAMVLIEAPSPSSPLLPTEHILSVIDAHATTTALLLLPGIQFYTGQYFDIPRITAHAHAHGITVGWDLAHAAGNVPLHLHAWNVDFAAWCTYKYLNAGPGATGALFVHARHAAAPRLQGWWGSRKASRFAMANAFDPIPGALGFQLSNPSALDLAAVAASLAVFARTDMSALRAKSCALTAYLEALLDHGPGPKCFRVITPRDPEARGAQLSVLLDNGLLDAVMRVFEEEGVAVDERKPNVIRVAPAPLYNNWEDVWRFCDVFRRACAAALAEKQGAVNGANGSA